MLRSFLTVLVLAGVSMADDSKLKVKIGDTFPDVAVKSTNIDQIKKHAKEVSIKDLKGKVVVIFFYPKAMTPGCTTESCGFRDHLKEFPEGVVVLGASNDTVEANKKFNDKEMLPYPLLSDSEGKLIKALGIQSAKGANAQRLTFIVDKDGKIAKIYEKVNPKDHPETVLKDVKEMVKK